MLNYCQGTIDLTQENFAYFWSTFCSVSSYFRKIEYFCRFWYTLDYSEIILAMKQTLIHYKIRWINGPIIRKACSIGNVTFKKQEMCSKSAESLLTGALLKRDKTGFAKRSDHQWQPRSRSSCLSGSGTTGVQTSRLCCRRLMENHHLCRAPRQPPTPPSTTGLQGWAQEQLHLGRSCRRVQRH